MRLSRWLVVGRVNVLEQRRAIAGYHCHIPPVRRCRASCQRRADGRIAIGRGI
jgi:hypothetical protein